MRIIRIVPLLLILSFSLTIVLAQTDCPALVQAAVETVSSACNMTGRNQLCYGNGLLKLLTSGTVNDLSFEHPGDLLDTDAVQSLVLSPTNLTDETWSMVVMNIQANLPASTDKNVRFVLFGDLELDNLGTAIQVKATVSAPNQINVRSAPSTQGSIVDTLNPNDAVTINGRNASGDWLHVQLGEGKTGWLAAYLIKTDADLTVLSQVDNEMTSYAPMQAFKIRTGIGDTPCAESPNSGLLIQTPEGAGNIQLQVNGVDFQLNGTAFLEAEAGNALFINLLEGTGTITALDKSEIIPAGAASSVPIDDNLLVSDVPTKPIPYTLEDLQSLPVSLLPRSIDIQDPLLQRQINFLTDCRVMSEIEGMNFRQGPAIAYFATGTLRVNTPYLVSGRTLGKDGFVWWRVSSQHWVRDDVVTTSGNCDDVPSANDRPAQPSTTGYSTDLTCTSERVIYAKVGDTIPISDTYYSSDVSVGDIVTRFFIDGNAIYEGIGASSGNGLIWTTSWVATAGIHNVEAQYTPTVELKPDWAKNPFKPGESWSHKVCQIRVE